jgi:hypothetical protein
MAASPIVTLTDEQVVMVNSKVDEMLAYVRAKGHKQRFTPVAGETERSVNLQGHAAEFAFSLWSGLPWSALFVPGPRFVKVPDVGEFEVRHSRRTDASLPLHDYDDDRPFVLVTGEIPTFTMRGWAWPHDVRRKEFWRDKSARIVFPAYFVPQYALRPMDTLGVPTEPVDVVPPDGGVSPAEAVAASICLLARFRHGDAGRAYDGIGHKPSCRFCDIPEATLVEQYGIERVMASQLKAFRALPPRARAAAVTEAQEAPWYDQLEG